MIMCLTYLLIQAADKYYFNIESLFKFHLNILLWAFIVIKSFNFQ
jgi:hypothetical protein